MENDENLEMSPFSSLPKVCIAKIISSTSPKDACKAAVLSSEIKSAADSDYAWEPFLPPDYKEMILESNTTVPVSSKKDLYFFLCDFGLRDNRGKLNIRYCRFTGKKCYMVGARQLDIADADWTKYHWYWPGSRFAEVVECKNSTELYISGAMPSGLLLPGTCYVAYLVFKLAESHHGLDTPLKVRVRGYNPNEPYHYGFEEDNEEVFRISYIVLPEDTRMLERDVITPKGRPDGWLEIQLGEFLVSEGYNYGAECSLLKDTGVVRCGLIIEGIEVRPKMA